MIQEQDIKPIPKYILKLIMQKDTKAYAKHSGTTRFYSYFTKHKKELLQITVAVRNKGKNWYCKQVAIHGINSDKCLVKDMEYFNIGGYVVGWFKEGITKFPKWYETRNWCEAPDKYYNPYAPPSETDKNTLSVFLLFCNFIKKFDFHNNSILCI